MQKIINAMMFKSFNIALALFEWFCHQQLAAFKKSLNESNEENEKLLRNILSHNRKTEIGTKYNFARLSKDKNLQTSYQSQLPISHFDDYKEAFEKIRRGKSNVLFPGKPKLFVSTSGTSGDAKLFPMTGKQQRKQVKNITILGPAVRSKLYPQSIMFPPTINLMLASKKQNYENGIPVGMSSAGGMKLILPFTKNIWVSPKETFELDKHNDALYLHALFGLLNEEIQCIEAIFASHVLSWIDMMITKQKELLTDIETGTLTQNLTISTEQREAINAYLKPNPERAKQLSKHFAGNESRLLQKLWPQLAVINTVVSGSFSINLPRINALKSESTKIYTACFGCTEAMIGINLDYEYPEHYTLAIGSTYFEFVAVDNNNEIGNQTIALSELMIGKCYLLVITNFAGLYRYRLDDVFRIVGFNGTAPIIEFVYRLGTILDLVGEKTTEKHTINAVSSMVQKLTGDKASIVDFCFRADLEQKPYRYIAYIELVSGVSINDLKPAADLLDHCLQQENPSYRTLARSNNRLQPLQIKILKLGTFNLLMDTIYQQTPGLGRNQVKIPRVISKADHCLLLEKQTIKSI